MYMSSNVRDTKTSDPKLIAVALTFKSVDPLGVSEYLILYLFAFVTIHRIGIGITLARIAETAQ